MMLGEPPLHPPHTRSVLFITHPEVTIDPELPVPLWSLSETGAQRMRAFAQHLRARNVRFVWSSEERKAVEAAQILAGSLGLSPRTYAPLGENDRSSTGYLDKARFEAMAERFFAQPELSAEGWERAVDAQHRIVGAVEHVIAGSEGDGDVAIVSHGGVGTLLLCALMQVPIARRYDQSGQGHWYEFSVEKERRRVRHGWRRLE